MCRITLTFPNIPSQTPPSPHTYTYTTQARHSFLVPADRVYLHTYTASSTPELLAEEAEGEVVILEFQGLRVNSECLCARGRESGGGLDGGSGERRIEHSAERMEGSSMSDSVSNVSDREGESERDGERERERERESDKNTATLSPHNPNSNNNNNNNNTTEDSYNTQKEGNETKQYTINTIITKIEFSFPIHLRYHTPHDDLLSVKNTKTVENSDFKTVIVPHPTVYLGTENCEKKSKSVFETPSVKRIYDISFLGQNGNALSSVSNDHFYVKLNNLKNENENLSGDDYLNFENNDNNSNDSNYQHNNNQHNNNRNNNNNNNNKYKNKYNAVELSVPVGCYSNNFVLFATVFCYFVTSGGIVVSLLF